MNHSAQELQSQIFTILDTSLALQNLIGTNRIYDEVPHKAKPPYVTFGKSVHLDWSTGTGAGTETGMEHEIELHIWSTERGRKQIFEIQALVIALLADLSGNIGDHYLVNFTHESSEVEARNKYRSFRGISTFRAITEPLI